MFFFYSDYSIKKRNTNLAYLCMYYDRIYLCLYTQKSSCVWNITNKPFIVILFNWNIMFKWWIFNIITFSIQRIGMKRWRWKNLIDNDKKLENKVFPRQFSFYIFDIILYSAYRQQTICISESDYIVVRCKNIYLHK